MSINADEFYTGRQFQQYFEKSANSMVIKANPPHFTILVASDRFLQSTHRHRSELLGKDLFEIFPGSHSDASEKATSYDTFVKAIETGKRVDWPTFRYEILNPETGQMEVQYWSNYHEPIVDADGKVNYIINTTNNITAQILETTEKELVQSQLRASEQNLRNVVRQAPVGMCIVKGEPLYVEEVNDLFLEIIGKRREQFESTPYWDVNAEAKAYYKPITDQVISRGTTYHANEHKILLIRHGKPETVYVDFVYEPMKDTNGIAYAIIIVAIEVTEKVVARKELQSAYEQIQLSKEAAQLGTFDMDVVTGYMEWDERCRTLFGISHQDAVTYAGDFVAGLHPDDRDLIQEQISRLFKGEIADGNYDVEYRTIGAEDGKLRWVRAKGKVLFNDKSEAIRFIGSVLDITDQKEDEQRKNDFIGMVSHELKTPLTSLGAYVQMLLGKARRKNDYFTEGALEKAYHQVKRMSSMINGFLNLSRLESGKMHLQPELFDIEDLVKELVDETSTVSPNHLISLTACDTTTISADRDKIASVISNLLSNAIKYSPKGHNIDVECSRVNDYVQISVKDEGMGIKPEDVDKLFERYYRVNSKHTQNISGFGIGLYLCAEIIHRHHGKIWVESEVGVGSTFFFTLPINQG